MNNLLEREVVTQENIFKHEMFKNIVYAIQPSSKQLKGAVENRLLNRNHINKVKSKIQEHNYVPAFPVLIDKDEHIIDGQHRYAACKEMGIPFLTCQVLEIKDNLIIDINNSQKNWSMDDYIHYHATKGLRVYQKIAEFAKDTSLKPSVALTILQRTINGGGDTERLKAGALCFNDKQFKDGYVLASQIKATVKFMGLPMTDRLVRALIKANNDKNFTFKILTMKLTYQKDKIYRCSTTDGYCKMLEDIYNCKNSKKISIAR